MSRASFPPVRLWQFTNPNGDFARARPVSWRIVLPKLCPPRLFMDTVPKGKVFCGSGDRCTGCPPCQRPFGATVTRFLSGPLWGERATDQFGSSFSLGSLCIGKEKPCPPVEPRTSGAAQPAKHPKRAVSHSDCCSALVFCPGGCALNTFRCRHSGHVFGPQPSRCECTRPLQLSDFRLISTRPRSPTVHWLGNAGRSSLAG